MKVGAIILAGGKSSRMGTDKGLLELNGRPMIVYLIETLKNITDEIIIISNQDEYKIFGCKVYADLIKDSGPLAGIYTGLKYATYHKNIVLSCDIPFVSQQLLQFIVASSNGYDVTIASKNNKTHQVIGVYDKKCSTIFKKELDQNQRKVKIALEKVNLKIVDANEFDEKEFTNVNTPAEFKEIQ